ncbi:hypothetical protein NpPPO83_00002908 [Neofusicoccum parvum]|uniref:Uncharacterized protein n=1 Tax=Neofusicoccum parvum TaxID=310453 RepID=A0ACB5S477_9PEZI|nr:hypothetical protein NpPPO83_00002908 [Neofusicoccum parvum]
MQSKPDDTPAAGPSPSPAAAATPAADPTISSVAHQLETLDLAPPAPTPASAPATPSPPPTPPTRPRSPERGEPPGERDANEDAWTPGAAPPESDDHAERLSNLRRLWATTDEKMVEKRIAQCRAALEAARRRGRGGAGVAKRSVGRAASWKDGLARRAVGMPNGTLSGRLVWSVGGGVGEVEMEGEEGEEWVCVPAAVGESDGMDGGEASGDADMGDA